MPRTGQTNPFSDPLAKKVVCDTGKTLILLVWFLLPIVNTIYKTDSSLGQRLRTLIGEMVITIENE